MMYGYPGCNNGYTYGGGYGSGLWLIIIVIFIIFLVVPGFNNRCGFERPC